MTGRDRHVSKPVITGAAVLVLLAVRLGFGLGRAAGVGGVGLLSSYSFCWFFQLRSLLALSRRSLNVSDVIRSPASARPRPRKTVNPDADDFVMRGRNAAVAGVSVTVSSSEAQRILI